jgi:hypothetical protein
MAGYTKEFLVSVFLERYISLPTPEFESLENMANKFYDEKGKDHFRIYANVTASAIRAYNEIYT